MAEAAKKRRLSFPARLLMAIGVSVALPEIVLNVTGAIGTDALRIEAIDLVLSPFFAWYLPWRARIVTHPLLSLVVALLAAGTVLGAVRGSVLLWYNEVLPRLTGTNFLKDKLTFEKRTPDLLELIAQRPPGMTVVGMTPPNRIFGRWQALYLSERQRSTHRQVIGKSGSGKTVGVLLPQALQDALDGKGIAFIDGKGSDENIESILGLAVLAGRQSDVRVFSLPAWNDRRRNTHTYNMVRVVPRGPGPEVTGGDPVVVAERVLSVLPFGDNRFYNVQSQLMFTRLCRLLHGIVDDEWRGIPFVLNDIGICVQGLPSLVRDDFDRPRNSDDNEDEKKGKGAKRDGFAKALHWCLEHSKDRGAKIEIEAQVRSLGRRVGETFTGLTGALATYSSPIVNAYDPDIVLEEVLEKNLIVYFQLPGNLFKIQSPALGRVFLRDIEQQGSLRQVCRGERNQAPFAVIVDEVARFAEKGLIDSLNQSRDANLQFTFAHQSEADLEMLSSAFKKSVWDNSRVKDVLLQNSPELCEMVAKSIGTEQVVECTVRRESGPLWTSILTQDSSNRLVEAYRLHPNRIKNLERCGQGYLYTDETIKPVCYPVFSESLRAHYELPKKDQSQARGLRLQERFIEARNQKPLKSDVAPLDSRSHETPKSSCEGGLDDLC